MIVHLAFFFASLLVMHLISILPQSYSCLTGVVRNLNGGEGGRSRLRPRGGYRQQQQQQH